eukprot:5049782-Prymnesium_polylepis.1
MSCLDTERRLKCQEPTPSSRSEEAGGMCSKPFLVGPKTKMLFFAELRLFDSRAPGRGSSESDEPFLRS